MVRNWHFQHCGLSSTSDLGIKIPHQATAMPQPGEGGGRKKTYRIQHSLLLSEQTGKAILQIILKIQKAKARIKFQK